MRPCIGDNTAYCVQSYHLCPGIDMSNLEAVILLMKNHLQQLPENNQQETLTLMNSPVEGRGLFAVRDIFPGELIFVDHSLIYGPRISEDVTISCVNCYDSVKALHTCTCGLPICSEECQNSLEHKSECELIGSWKPRTSCIDSNAFARNVVPIRALLLNDQRKEFLKSLAVHDSPQHGAEVRFIKKHFEISDEQEVLMMQACRALDANAYEMFKKTKTDRSVNLRGLFPISALLNHACSPNTRNSFDFNGRMYVKASTYIPEGAEIFTSYTGLLWGTPVRRHHLKNTKHFLCDCCRCCDRTEFGTKLAAMRCLNRSCSGISLPDDPLNYSSSWVCDSCDLHVPPVQVGSLQTAIARLIGSVEMSTPDDINDFVTSHLTKFLPESNHIVLELKCRIIWALGSTEGYKWNGKSFTRFICLF